MAISPVRIDYIQRPQPDSVRMVGLLGERFDLSRRNRLHLQEEYFYLWPFQEHLPLGWDQTSPPHPEITRGDWQGEFLGTYLDAACLTAWCVHDNELRQKIDVIIKDWLNTQQEDGYLGTYDEEYRWQSWDVWVQAHNLIGLLSYYRYTGDKISLKAALRVADRVLQDFGPGKEYLHNGPHCGMASSAILEPMMWLYWESGEKRYLEFGHWLVDEDWETPGGPAIISSLMAGKGVAGTANAKGVEMLVDFAGIVELYRATGDERYLKPILIAWDDIVQHHLYITGSASTGECFLEDYVLRNDGVFRLGETCVTMAWLYLNLSLGRLTGEARFFDMVEQALYNHLLGAQSPDGRGWAYYMGLRDSKRYRWHTDPECCPSKGARALAQIPMSVFGIVSDGVAVNFYESSEATLTLSSGSKVSFDLRGKYPFDGNIQLKVILEKSTHFKIYLRLPGWCQNWQLRLNDTPVSSQPDTKGYLVIERDWDSGDLIELNLEMPVRIVIDKLGNNGRVALVRGPLVYAIDSSYLPAYIFIDDVILKLDPDKPLKNVRTKQVEGTDSVHLILPMVIINPERGEGLWKEKERYYDLIGIHKEEVISDVELVPFFEAGNCATDAFQDEIKPNIEPATNITYQVWLPYYH